MVQAFSFWPCFALPHPACIMNYAANHFQHCDKHVAVVRHGRSYCEHVFISSAMQTVKRCPAWINMLKQEQSVLGESFSSGLLSPTQCLGMSVSSVRTTVTFQSLGFFFFLEHYIFLRADWREPKIPLPQVVAPNVTRGNKYHHVAAAYKLLNLSSLFNNFTSEPDSRKQKDCLFGGSHYTTNKTLY